MAKKPKPKANSATSPSIFASSGWHNEHDLEFDCYFDPFNDGLVSAGEAEYLHSIGEHGMAKGKHLNAAQAFFKYSNGFEESGSAIDRNYNLLLSAEQYLEGGNAHMAIRMAEKIDPDELLHGNQQLRELVAQLESSDNRIDNQTKHCDSHPATTLLPDIAECYNKSTHSPHNPSICSAGKSIAFALPDGVPIAFSWCPPGTFYMGSNDANHNERPFHMVKISKGFFASTTPITLRQWNSVMGSDLTRHAELLMRKHATPGIDIGQFISDERPVQRVNWIDCQKYLGRLMKITGMNFRLPYEAEWEYACRAETTTEYNYGEEPNSDYMNYNAYCVWNNSKYGQFRKQITPVASFPPNSWGLCDFHGNVWEWCQDGFGSKYYEISSLVDPTGPRTFLSRVCRGGSWRDIPQMCRSTTRDGHYWYERRIGLGFRIVLALG